MGYKLAVDFGTTNTVAAYWREDTPEILRLPRLSIPGSANLPPLVPSLVYVQRDGPPVLGQIVRDQALDKQRDNRLFRNFKRGIVTLPPPAPREIDGALWGDREVGRVFLEGLLDALPFGRDEIEQLVLTVPVASFEHYIDWLSRTLEGIDSIRVVDESTAAALGYAVTNPGTPVLVLDFGGGTLDLSLIQLPESREKTGGLLSVLRRGKAAESAARVIAKAGRLLGGSDIDQWIVADVLRRVGLSAADLGSDYPALLTTCEDAKIALSMAESMPITFQIAGASHTVELTRAALEQILEANGFFTALGHVIDKVMHVARREGIFREDVGHVLMVGGTALMPCVLRSVRQYFREAVVRSDKPFTAVAEGALQIAAGYGLDDYLVNSYGLRHLDPETGEHTYDEIIPQGSRYPTTTPFEVLMGAAHPNQASLEFVIGLIDSEAASLIEVQYEQGQAVFVARADRNTQRVMALNESAPPVIVALDPPGQPGEDRIRAAFSIDAERHLRVNVTDLKTHRELLKDQVVVTVR